MKQIIAMGGGGFSMEPENPLLDDYILAQAEKEKPKVCFVPTASGDSDSYIQRFYDAFNQKAETSHLSLFKPPVRDLRLFLLEQDIVYVGGGSTKNLLVLWREWGIDEILKEAWEKGVILVGISAGAICWFDEGVTDSYGDQLEPIPCLGFLPGSCCPHYDGEVERRPAYTTLIKEGSIRPGYALDDGAAIHFIDIDPAKYISSRSSAKGFYVRVEEKEVEENRLNMDYLG
ncbi:Peptidase E [Halobacillus karajensis]|uniref:(Alpha)-aspartyl dipeptidase n=1 Tax=Halobacillus karajensis TaxID=195088 RepID=A0A024P9K9_9BACI|nr:peptidase E [Halobacillus karajensis]CDQ21481.1 (alpha)-aspartyl dipeptidase [Halobacillus karajensis]CDQ25416.1 (alpha)-aspartyl dipeptidase [Halobacillus karajensis]CDQ29740.1 (alpha)-aspartyl dipeptidase [Halobacillus karajensis]SEI08123.1 Peptidase E [Halobacillus karajensis]